jgi:hypothetical protein
MRVTRSRTLGLRMITKARKFMIVVDQLRYLCSINHDHETRARWDDPRSAKVD